jgi:hypothetical protein
MATKRTIRERSNNMEEEWIKRKAPYKEGALEK